MDKSKNKRSTTKDENCTDIQQSESFSIKDPEKIVIRIVGSQETRYKLKKTQSLSGPMKMYSRKMGVPPGTYRFVFEGCRVSDNDTPESLEMKTGDIIEVYKNQLGGSELNGY